MTDEDGRVESSKVAIVLGYFKIFENYTQYARKLRMSTPILPKHELQV